MQYCIPSAKPSAKIVQEFCFYPSALMISKLEEYTGSLATHAMGTDEKCTRFSTVRATENAALGAMPAHGHPRLQTEPL
jgi:hypothetical protein